MSAASEMWSSAEKTSVPAGSPRSTSGAGRRSFGAPRPSAGYVSVLEFPLMAPTLLSDGRAADYFGLVAIVNGAC